MSFAWPKRGASPDGQRELPERLETGVTGLGNAEAIVTLDDALHVLRIHDEPAVLAEHSVAGARNVRVQQPALEFARCGSSLPMVAICSSPT